ncbi:hypothetical protein [Allopusillimonas ginsengisoli]|uniref:hypothetical protein n=1 Tax=Allopusillimonas ginsengisoli TaxID=453575 RepID=UPI00101F4C50|nr:hypothetical protein [Allopusillimonas ginsengisoli]TEA78682.1 hypothetical protein ERE07_09820 [Allopusillimonas ginsengisoli]
MEATKFFQEYGYWRDREPRLREVAGGNATSLSLEAANQIKHLKGALSELASIVEIHSRATNNNFAWAELDEAKIALSGQRRI